MLKIFVVLIFSILFSACREEISEPPIVAQAAITTSSAPRATSTPLVVSPSPTPTSISSPTITSTPLPTATATPTAVPVEVMGNPRTTSLSAPVANGNAPCGVVDLLDFPLDPPHGENARGGGDFGIWRNRYEKYHAGEDWRMVSGGNFGEPVLSIGHGLVTYANPDGWGRDKGVIIVRHTFADGDSILSFYGHLDPPSVLLKAGLCVTRGDQVGQIGKPRTSPHLHFELRTHMPYQTGTGYWFEDPRLEGWLPPSQTIWHSRIASAPGVQWTYMAENVGLKNLGITDEQTLVATEGDQLRGIDTANGSLLWEFPLPEESGPAMLDARQRILYSASQLGIIEAYRLPAAPADEVAATNLNDLDFLWSIDLDLVGIPLLLPLPNGGIVIFAWGQMLALSSEGDLLWEIDDVGRPFDWIQVGDQLLVSSLENGGSLLSIDAETAVIWEHSMGGILEATNGHALLYEKDGVYQLDLAEMSVELLLDLPGRRIDLANILALSGGNILLSHLDPVDQRLILLDSQGNMLWQRSTVDLFSGETKFFELGGQAYLLAADEGSDFNNIRIYAVDKSSGDLTHLFSGGSRSAITGYSDFIALPNDQLLVNIGGRSVTAVDLKAAAVEIEQ